MLLHASRRGSSLTIASAFRIFPQVIQLPSVPTPRHALTAFVERYGTFFERKGLFPPTKLVEDFAIDQKLGDLYPLILPVDKSVAYVESGDAQSVHKGGTLIAEDLRIMFAYAIDLQMYHSERRLYD